MFRIPFQLVTSAGVGCGSGMTVLFTEFIIETKDWVRLQTTLLLISHIQSTPAKETKLSFNSTKQVSFVL